MVEILWLPLALCLACIMAFATQGCGPALGELHDEHVAHDEVRRGALKITPVKPVSLKAGQEAELNVTLQVKRGFYIVARGEPDKALHGAWLEPPARRVVGVGTPQWPKAHLVRLPGHAQPIRVHDGTVNVVIKLSAHAKVSSASAQLPLKLHYQLCTVRGCEVPQSRVVPTSIQVSAAE